MRKLSLFSVVLTLFLFVPASIIWAQNISSQKGLTTAIFNTNYGNIKVYLPEDIRPGDMISGTVMAEPSGNNPKQLAKNLTELRKYSISINSEKFSVDNSDKAFKFFVNADRGITGSMQLIHVSGMKAGELSVPTLPEKDRQPAPSQCLIPSHALTGSPLRIRGPFDGDAANTKCSLNNQSLKILAETKRECFVNYPLEAGGVKTLIVQDNGKSPCSKPVSGVSLNVSAGKLNLSKTENTYIDVTISGLQNLPDTAFLSLFNTTSDIVAMLPSNTIAIPLPPASVSSGTFNRRFDIHSIRSGSFAVSVNLDLPEVQADHPPTQPQPGDHPQPRDTTQPQPPHDSTTVAQCPGCTCSCSATIVLKSVKGDESTYRAEVTASCQGKSVSPPCSDCKIIDDDGYLYEWTLIDGSGKQEKVGVNYSEVTISTKDKNGYSLSVSVNVHCSDGHKCTCEAKTSGLPAEPQPVKGTCECNGSCSIFKTNQTSTHIGYDVFVRADCKGASGTGDTRVLCAVKDIEYLWHIDDTSVVDIDGDAKKNKVKLKIKKPGRYSINLTVTITCSDGIQCKRNCNMEGEIPPPWPNPATCLMESEEFDAPAMTGRLKPEFVINEETKIKRDDFISLGAEGHDDDQLTWTCIPETKCAPGDTKTILLNGRVRFKWVIVKGDGSFVKLGCLPDNEWEATGDYVVFKPPVIPMPVQTDTIATTMIRLEIIDDNPTQPQDKTVIKEVTITTKRSQPPKDGTDPTRSDFYKIMVKSDTREDKKIIKSEPPIEANCKPAGPVWSKPPLLGSTAIELPDVPDKEFILLGQWIVLKAKDLRDIDQAQKVACESSKCLPPPPFEKDYEDDIAFIWQRPNQTMGRGTFGNFQLKDTGSTVIYKTPDKWPEEVKADFFDIDINLYAVNPAEGERKDPDGGKSTITLRVYRPGVKLSLVPLSWLPTDKGNVELTSSLMMKDGNWKIAPAHACRIHFFELMDVSNEKGVCMNDPLPDKAKLCRDLKILKEKGQEAFWDTSKLTDCNGKEYFMQARTEAPVHSYKIKIYSEDYGAYGHLRSFANLNKGGDKNIIGDLPYYEPIPITSRDAPHPSKIAGRGKFDYKDNRVSIPLDVDNNHIADGGWTDTDEKKGRIPDPLNNNVDDDADPPGASRGDGLTNYEEYRGFMIKPKKIVEISKTETVEKEVKIHVRPDPGVKSIFIHNKNDLPIKLYAKISKLEVFEITEAQYQSYKIRIVNFNSNPLTHIVDQKGLYLYDGGYRKDLYGKAYSKTGLPARPNEEDSIVIYLERLREHVAEINKLVDKFNQDPAKIKEAGGKFTYLDLEAKKAAVVAHELLHGNNVCHHGEGNDQLQNQSHDLVHGLRSGDISCVMRYDNTGNSYFLKFFPEKPGTELCSSPFGTGYNAPPLKKNAEGLQIGWGDCAPGRGNCASQIWISGAGQSPVPCPRPK